MVFKYQQKAMSHADCSVLTVEVFVDWWILWIQDGSLCRRTHRLKLLFWRFGSWTFHEFGVLELEHIGTCSNHLDLEYYWRCDSINLQQAAGCVWFEIVALLLGPFGALLQLARATRNWDCWPDCLWATGKTPQNASIKVGENPWFTHTNESNTKT